MIKNSAEKSALIIHGTPDKKEYYSSDFPSPSNSHWLPWLQKELLVAGYLAQTPEMPKAYLPYYEGWKDCFEQFEITNDSILVGHSCGGGFLLRWLSENKINIAKTVLVAPWLDPLKRKDPNFFNFNIDSQITDRTNLHIVFSDNDAEDINLTVEMIKTKLPNVNYHLFQGFGHFCYGDMGTLEFPELIKIVLGRK